LINPPYHAYESVIQFFERAAADPDVTHIKLVQYRVGAQSRIMSALKEAVQNGKQVTVFIEVKARFDEEANLRWGEELERNGVTVHYSFPGLKVHAKLAMVRRIEKDGPIMYTYLSTGNFHEGTARVYSDLGLFTADERITGEVAQVFSFLETVKLPEQGFEHLLVGQFNLVDTLTELIHEEVRLARLGLPAEICLKLNSLQDPFLIHELYQASQAGVRVRIIVRGICSLIPGVPGLSDNIEAISIVDRFLEHTRVFFFHNQGDPKIYISSADWMVRNLYYRIETACPIYHPAIREILMDLFEIQWNDTLKARIIDEHQTNAFRRPEKSIALRSQHETYFYFKRRIDTGATKSS
ncbi:MAG TPA: polyphosphate kinase 1, partial [Saprospiraceae bacterium]|nr:polyphosphate kinase 1 [Saprospiraceae bacterium]